MSAKRHKLYQALRRYYIIFSIFGMVSGLVIYSIFAYEAMKSFAMDNLINARDQQVMFIESWLHERTRDIKQISLSTVVKQKDFAGMKELCNDYLTQMDGNFDSIAFVDSSGVMLVEGTQENPQMKIWDRGYFIAAMEGRETIGVRRIDGKQAVLASCPVFSNSGQILGLVAGSLSLDKLDDLTSALRFGDTGETYLVDADGIMLSESRFNQWLIDKGMIHTSTKNYFRIVTEAVDLVTKGQKGYGEYKGYRGHTVLGAYQWLPRYKWGVVVETEKSEIMGGFVQKNIFIILPLLLLFLCVSYPLSSYFTWKIVSPLSWISKRIAPLAENSLSSLANDPVVEQSDYEEIDSLYKAFYRMKNEIGQLRYTLESQVLYDPLTGLANRLFFFSRGEEIIELSRRHDKPCSVIYLDIDKFRKINDALGHHFGDQALIQLAAIIKRTIRLSDVAGRLGGEEFAIISPECGIEGALQLAERLRVGVQETPMEIYGNTTYITLSIGVTVFSKVKKDLHTQEILESLICQSDAAMRLAQENGYNRVEVYKEEGSKK